MADDPMTADDGILAVLEDLKTCDRTRVLKMVSDIQNVITQTEANNIEALWSIVSIMVAYVRAIDNDYAASLAKAQAMISFSMGMAEQRDAKQQNAPVHEQP